MARAHVEAYRTLPKWRLWLSPTLFPVEPMHSFNEKLFSARAFENFHHLLEMDLDGVSVCTPNASHHYTSIDAVTAGKHLLVEKPMSVTLEEAVNMAQASKRANRMLSVGFQPRYDPNMQIIRDIVQSGQLGKVYYVETGGGRRRGMPGGTFIRKELAGAGAMADIGCYSLDMALNALGYPKPLTVSASTSNHFGINPTYHPESDQFDVEDFGVALVRLEGNIMLQFKISWAMHMDTLGSTFFLGTEGGLKINPAGESPWSGVWDGSVGSIKLFHDIRGHHTESPIPIPIPIQHHSLNLFHEKVRDFVHAIESGRAAPIPGEQILYNQAIIDAVQRSSELNSEVEIHIPTI